MNKYGNIKCAGCGSENIKMNAGYDGFDELSAELARKQLTQSRLGEKMNLDDSTMSLKMTGKREITLGEAKKMKSILSVEMPLDELFATAN